MGNIGIIGIGALGRRHLQSLINLKDEHAIYGVEKDISTIGILKDEFEGVTLCEHINELPGNLDFCVIATSANVRKSVFDELIEHVNVRYILFEKVLFQSVADYSDVETKLQEKKIKAWVNCARREWKSYQWLKREIADEKTFTYTVTGGEWGLCCNGIHMIDLLQYLTNCKEYTVDCSRFLSGIAESKRKGFKEVYGTIAGKCGKCSFYQISCMQGTDTPSLLMINSDGKNIIVDEMQQKAYISKRENGWKWETREFMIEYQSQLTGRIVKEILEKGACNLTTYETSMYTHLKYINMWLTEFHKQGVGGDICPIT